MSMRQLKITKSITNRESQSLEKYLQEIGKVELITPEEEVKLAKRIKQGDPLISLPKRISGLWCQYRSSTRTRVFLCLILLMKATWG